MRKKFLFWAMFFCVGLFTFMCKSNLAFGEDFTCNNNTYKTISDTAIALTSTTNTNLIIPEQISYYINETDNTKTKYKEGNSYIEGYNKTITYTVTQIDASYDNFKDCKTMSIPKSVTTINSPKYLFVEKFTVDAYNNSFSSDETGVLFSKDGTTLLRFPVAVSTDTDYTIPESVTTIATRAFSMSNDYFNQVFTPTVNINIKFSSNVTTLEERNIFDYSTYSTIDLKNFLLPLDNIDFAQTKIGTLVLPNNITTLNLRNFHSGTADVIQLPATITEIAEDTIIILTAPLKIANYDGTDYNGDYFLFEDGVLFNKNKTHLIRFMNNISHYDVPDTVKLIESYAFYESDLTTVALSEKLEALMHGCFLACPNLSSITIPKSVDTISDCTFMMCPQIKTIKILGDLKSVGYSVFDGCQLDTIIIPCTFDKSRFTMFSGITVATDSDKFYYNSYNGETIKLEGKFEYLHRPMLNSNVNKIICVNCEKEVTSTFEHTHEFAEANCLSPAHCTICGVPKDYSDMNTNPNNHEWEIEPTTGYPKCKLCGTGSATSSKKIIITRTANDFVYNNMSWDEFGFIKKES